MRPPCKRAVCILVAGCVVLLFDFVLNISKEIFEILNYQVQTTQKTFVSKSKPHSNVENLGQGFPTYFLFGPHWMRKIYSGRTNEVDDIFLTPSRSIGPQ